MKIQGSLLEVGEGDLVVVEVAATYPLDLFPAAAAAVL
jgi:hypothetical protein